MRKIFRINSELNHNFQRRKLLNYDFMKPYEEIKFKDLKKKQKRFVVQPLKSEKAIY